MAFQLLFHLGFRDMKADRVAAMLREPSPERAVPARTDHTPRERLL